jgi:Peptidase family M28
VALDGEGNPHLSDQPRIPRQIAGPIALALLILLGLLAIHRIEPPSAADANAPLSEFSAARAMRDVREIAKAPRMLGSSENDRVRDYLVGRLRELGASPAVQTATVTRHTQSGPDAWAVVNNVVATIPGTNPTGSVLIVAHYDSAPSGPGAADNGASVAAILEAMRALKAGPAARNDLIILFTDGEELGLLGAKAFVETQPALSNVKVVLNFDMRGDNGPSVIFQTRSQHSWLAARPPLTPSSSLTEASAWGETDLDVFLAAGMDGVSFGPTRGIAGYQTELDNADLLDQRSLQSQGALALSTAREFGAIDLNDLHTESAASIVRDDSLSHYTTIALAFLVLLLLLGVMWIGIRAGQFTIAGLAAGIATYVVTIAASIVAAIFIWHLTATLAGWRMLPIGTTYGGFYFAIATDALIFGACWAAYIVISRSIGELNLGVGALVVLTVMVVTASILIPSGAHLYWWLLLAMLAISMSFGVSDGRVTTRGAILGFIALAFAMILTAPSLAASADGTMLLLVYGGLASAFLFGLFIPYMDLLTGGRRSIVPAALGSLAIVMIVKGNAASSFDASQPHPDSIFYFADTDRARARWVSLDSRPDTFTTQFFQHHVHGGWLQKLAGLATRDTPDAFLAKLPRDFSSLNRGRTTEGDATLIDAAPPVLRVLDDSTVAGTRTVSMHIASARKAAIIWMSVPVGVAVLGASIDGRSPGDRVTDGWTGWYWRAPATGFDLTLKLATPAPFVVTVIDQTDGLPDTAGLAVKPRPPDTMPTPFLFFDSTTLVRKTFAIGGEQLSGR